MQAQRQRPVPSGSRTQTVEEAEQAVAGPSEPHHREQDASQTVGVLKLRGAPARRQKVMWTEETVDNEGMGKKKSKICCIYHRPRAYDESSTESDSSSCSDGEGGHNHSHGQGKRVGGMKKKVRVRGGGGNAGEEDHSSSSESSSESEGGQGDGSARPVKSARNRKAHQHRHPHDSHTPKPNKYDHQDKVHRPAGAVKG